MSGLEPAAAAALLGAAALFMAAVLGGAWPGERDLARKRGLLAGTPCPRCGEPFGAAAVAAAEASWRAEGEDLRRQSPGLRLRLVARWPLRCPACGAVARYRPAEGRFEEEVS